MRDRETERQRNREREGKGRKENIESRRKAITYASWLLMETDLNRNKKHNELALMVPRQVIALMERNTPRSTKIMGIHLTLLHREILGIPKSNHSG